MDHVAQTTPGRRPGTTSRAAVAYLRSPAGGSRSAIFTVGFCFGGRNSWLASAGGHGLAGAVGFYGMPGERNGAARARSQRVGEMTAPILALQAGADAHITRATINASFDAALTAAGVEHEIVTLSTARRTASSTASTRSSRSASDDAWRRTLSFIDAHTAARAGV